MTKSWLHRLQEGVPRIHREGLDRHAAEEFARQYGSRGRATIKGMTDPLTLFYFACAGASAAPFQRWRREVPPWLRIVPVERPGRGIRLREPHLRTFEEIVRLLTRDIGRDLPQNYALFGHSLGALLAFGCAQEIRRCALHPPKALAVAGSAAPSCRDDKRLTSLSTDQDLLDWLRRSGL